MYFRVHPELCKEDGVKFAKQTHLRQHHGWSLVFSSTNNAREKGTESVCVSWTKTRLWNDTH